MALTALFILGEIFRKGSFFLWLAFGSALSGILALLQIAIAGQVTVFLNISGILIVLERRFSERYTFKKHQHTMENNLNLMDNVTDLSEIGNLSQNVFRKRGPLWEIVYGGKSLIIKHSMGLSHIRQLIIKKGQWIHCSDLKRISSGSLSQEKSGHYGSMTEKQLELENLRLIDDIPPEDIIEKLPLEKIKKLRDILVERRDANDFKSPEEKIDQLNSLDFIQNFFNKVTNNKGKSRKIYNQADTDRKTVSAAINRSRNTLQEHKELYTHFKSFIQAEGNSFRYLPDRPIEWKTE